MWFSITQLELTKDMETVLDRGLKYAVLPLRLDITQVLVDFRRYERTMVWKKLWNGKK